jgi:enterochelin esterase family protein
MALERFWQEVETTGSPLIETLEGDASQRLVTFLWRDQGDTRNVVLVGGPASIGAFAENQMQRFLRTDLWYKTYQLPVDLRTTYQLSVNDPLTPCLDVQHLLKRMMFARSDPLNPQPITSPLGLPGRHQLRQVSVLELPQAPVQPWLTAQPHVPRGRVKMSLWHSQSLLTKYHIAVYTPPGYCQDGAPYSVLLLFDGWMYMNYAALPTVLDNLLYAGKIPPCVVVMHSQLDYPTRNRDLLCSRPFVDALLQEFVPWIREQYHVTAQPERSIVGGVCAGGLAAAYTALLAPELFGNVLAQSGSFWWQAQEPSIEGMEEKAWLIQQFEHSPKLPLRFSLEIGTFDRYTLVDPVTANYQFRDVLLANGYDVRFAAFNGGHDFICWRGSFVDRFCELVNRQS